MGGRGSSSGMGGGGTSSLKGTDKQVKWGNEIRQSMRKGIDILDDKSSRQRAFAVLRSEYDMNGHLKTLNKDIRKGFNQIDSAKWFIDNRHIMRNANWYIDLARSVIDEKKIFKRK